MNRFLGNNEDLLNINETTRKLTEKTTGRVSYIQPRDVSRDTVILYGCVFYANLLLRRRHVNNYNSLCVSVFGSFSIWCFFLRFVLSTLFGTLWQKVTPYSSVDIFLSDSVASFPGSCLFLPRENNPGYSWPRDSLTTNSTAETKVLSRERTLGTRLSRTVAVGWETMAWLLARPSGI